MNEIFLFDNILSFIAQNIVDEILCSIADAITLSHNVKRTGNHIAAIGNIFWCCIHAVNLNGFNLVIVAQRAHRHIANCGSIALYGLHHNSGAVGDFCGRNSGIVSICIFYATQFYECPPCTRAIFSGNNANRTRCTSGRIAAACQSSSQHCHSCQHSNGLFPVHFHHDSYTPFHFLQTCFSNFCSFLSEHSHYSNPL